MRYTALILLFCAACGSAPYTTPEQEECDPVPEPRDECGADEGNPCTNNLIVYGECMLIRQPNGKPCQPCPGLDGACNFGVCE